MGARLAFPHYSPSFRFPCRIYKNIGRRDLRPTIIHPPFDSVVPYNNIWGRALRHPITHLFFNSVVQYIKILGARLASHHYSPSFQIPLYHTTTFGGAPCVIPLFTFLAIPWHNLTTQSTQILCAFNESAPCVFTLFPLFLI